MVCHDCHVWWRVPESDEYEFEQATEIVKCKYFAEHMDDWSTWKLIQTVSTDLELYKAH